MIEDPRHNDTLLDIKELCIELGGPTKPVNPATVHRMIKRGEFNPPIHPTPGISRWKLGWSREHKRRLAAGR